MRKPALEWICAAIGALIVLTTLAVIGLQIPGSGTAPPQIAVRASGAERVAGGYLVRIEAANTGLATAAAVEVEGRLEENGRVLETSRVTLDYVPRHSSTRGGLWFTRDPAAYQLNLRALGYQEP